MSYCIICFNYQNMKCIKNQKMNGLNSVIHPCIFFINRKVINDDLL